MTGNASQELLQARELAERVIRGELVAGIMSGDQVDEMVQLFVTAGANEPVAWFELGEMYLSGMMYGVDPDLAAVAFQQAYVKGHTEAFLPLAQVAYFHRAYLEECEVEIDQAALVDGLEAMGDDPDALLLLGYYKQQGYAMDPDPTAALAVFEKASALGNGGAMFELYVMHATGLGTVADPEAAHAWLLKAADAGNTRAMFNLGGMYATGNGVPFDEALSLSWYTKAADAGHGRAAGTLAYMYLTGEGAPQDQEKSDAFFNHAIELGFDADGFFAQLGL